MKRSSFRPKWTPTRKQREPDEFASFDLTALHKGVYSGRTSEVMVPKEEPARSEAYLRAVALLPCCYCGAEGRSQAAHGPTLGRSIKADDRTAIALCADGPAFKGCHSRADQYELFDRWERDRFFAIWGAETRKRIHDLGLWPAGLAFPEEEKEPA